MRLSIRLGFKMLLVAMASLLWLPHPLLAADHRDAPTVNDYSAADINDIFLFRDPGDSTKLVIVMTTQPLSDPKFGAPIITNQMLSIDFTLATRQIPSSEESLTPRLISSLRPS